MTTPINTLPLKTTPQQANESDLEDPMIQNVLKEFEDDMRADEAYSQQQAQSAPQYALPQQAQLPQQYQQQQTQSSQYPQYPQHPQYPHQYALNTSRKLFDIDTAKKTLIITIIVVLLQHNNILNILTSRLPESLNTYISGRELLINFLIIFLIFYALVYLDLF